MTHAKLANLDQKSKEREAENTLICHVDLFLLQLTPIKYFKVLCAD